MFIDPARTPRSARGFFCSKHTEVYVCSLQVVSSENKSFLFPSLFFCRDGLMQEQWPFVSLKSQKESRRSPSIIPFPATISPHILPTDLPLSLLILWHRERLHAPKLISLLCEPRIYVEFFNKPLHTADDFAFFLALFYLFVQHHDTWPLLLFGHWRVRQLITIR